MKNTWGATRGCASGIARIVSAVVRILCQAAKKTWRAVRGYKSGNVLIVFVVVQILCIGAWLVFGDRFPYGSPANIQTALKSIPPMAILATGVGLLMIAGEFDLSVGSNYALTAFILARAFNSGIPAPVAALMGLGLGAFIGLVNAFVTLKAKIPSFIATLGAMMFWRGIILVLSGSQPEAYRPGGACEAMFCASIGPIQAQFLWAIGVAVAAHLILERHKLGNHMFAVGGNRESAVAIGVSPNAVKLICFVIAGLLAAFAGLMASLRVHSVSPDQGAGLELRAIAACVIGGLSLAGGEGSILGDIPRRRAALHDPGRAAAAARAGALSGLVRGHPDCSRCCFQQADEEREGLADERIGPAHRTTRDHKTLRRGDGAGFRRFPD
ncbi:MAG: ABC transporter permease [Armatimonadota bacterium]|nr:ABC transporter permease [Armatimonadota bacterium]